MDHDCTGRLGIVRPKFVSVTGTFDGVAADPKNIIVVTCDAQLKADQPSGYDKVMIKPGANLQNGAQEYARRNKTRFV